ncbi:interferon-induced very large GTPase 1 [Hydra vulgaris]|uniref:interferon-induced very large GTPase 1 n=1 Tax=Hydra vulgaris TaxID=6087 RepID=UPI001F5E3A1A|nr:interferon-induced very large GTPase 1-like [Hydra vulgaris]XP_047142696.1 interferon-induced very large GTPase 1-like [Hydra vulgaris]XP_047142697.1 interferon-induced very large GTPase 1-like [Hydra vulgaris]
MSGMTLKEYKDSLLLSINETNFTRLDDTFSCECLEKKEIFQSSEKENILFVSRTVIEWCSELFFRHFNNLSNHSSQKDFINRINTLLINEMVDKSIPIVIGAYSIIFTFGYKHKIKFGTSFELCSKKFNLEQKIHCFISSLKVGKKPYIEVGVLFGFLEVKKSPKSIFEFYILIKEQISPTKILIQVKEYLLFWKDEDVKSVLEYLQDDKSLEQFFLPHSKSLHFSEMLKLYEKINFTSYMNNNFEIKHENKICRKDLYSVDLFHSQSSEVTKDCAKGEQFLFLKQLLSLNYNCRNPESIKKTEYSDHEAKLNNDDYNDDDDGFPELLVNSFANKMHDKKKSNADLVYEVFSVCDNFLLQDVYEKMTLCQLAVPIVSPRKGINVFHLWATRTVKKIWVTYSSQNEIQNHEKFITKQNMATITFCRIGSTRVSKSKVANLFLSSAQGWQEHSYFINRDIDSKSKLNRGCIELCWYCPDGRKQECLKDIHCIYNLRGNALKNNEQFQFLLNVSSVIIIIVEKSLEQNVKKLINLMDGFIVVVDLSHLNYIKSKNGKRIIFGALGMNLKELSKNLVELISSFKLKVMNLDDHASHALKLKMEVDENNEACQLGKQAANDFVNKLKRYSIKSLKDSVLPLQGKEFWIKWGEIDKQVARQQFVNPENIMNDSDEQRTRKLKVRDSQLQKGASSELIFFMERLLLFKNTIMQHYFIAWCQLILNEISETHLPQILREYKSSKKSLSKLIDQMPSERNNGTETITPEYVQKSIDQENNIIKKLSEDIDLVSFGFEHIFREFSQVYESYYEKSERISSCVSFLPKLVADLVIMGYPLEILDGDASHIPFIWVKQVLFEVKVKLGKDVNVFVLSVLGIQSTGKSTLLNTMFGTKFAVSSGRCTKGVHIQLIPVSSNMCKILNCDYFIVMDSEGLRPPEKNDSFKQDNEIATLIACLSNTTIINFMGQTISKEMSDILEIALHAYIRMNKVQIKSSCHMVFACTSDVTAKDKNTLGVYQVFKELNTLIKKIAIEEGRDDLFGGLHFVFPLIQEQFDKLNLTQKLNYPEHLPNLWKGYMSPPESTYGEILLELRDSICNGMMKNYKSIIKCQPLTEFILRLNDLWNAIKQENFVFGFKNNQAIQLFKKLQLFYENKISILKKEIYEESYCLGNEVLHQLDPLKKKDELTKFLIKFNKLNLKFSYCKGNVKKELEEYAWSMSDAETALSFLTVFLFDMEKKVNTYIDTVKTNIENKVKESCIKEKKAFKKREDFKKKCLIKAREVARKINILANKPSFDASVIKMNFKTIFKTWIEEARLEDEKNNKPVDSLISELWNKLIECFLDQPIFFNMNPSNINNDIKESLDFIKNLYRKENFFEYVRNEPIKLVHYNNAYSLFINETEAYKKAIPKRDKVIEETKAILNDFKVEMFPNYVFVISKILDSALKNLSGVVHTNFEFDKNFKIRFLTKLFAVSVNEIAYFEEEQLRKNSLSIYLQSKEDNLFKEFEDECLTVNSDVCQGVRFIKDILCPIIIEEIKLKVGFTVVSEMKKKKMFSNKEIMLYYLHEEFLNAPFIQIMSYLKDYNSYISSWIEKKVLNYCLHKEFLKNCITDKITFTINCFSKALKSISDNYQQMDLTSW